MREHRRDAVHAAHGDGDVARSDLRAERGRKGAEVRRVLEAQRKKSAFTVERELSGQREPAPWLSERKTSERVATHFTGRPSLCAASITATCSA